MRERGELDIVVVAQITKREEQRNHGDEVPQKMSKYDVVEENEMTKQ